MDRVNSAGFPAEPRPGKETLFSGSLVRKRPNQGGSDDSSSIETPQMIQNASVMVVVAGVGVERMGQQRLELCSKEYAWHHPLTSAKERTHQHQHELDR